MSNQAKRKATYAAITITFDTVKVHAAIENWPSPEVWTSAFGPIEGPKLEYAALRHLAVRLFEKDRQKNVEMNASADILEWEPEPRGGGISKVSKAEKQLEKIGLSTAELEELLNRRKALEKEAE